MRQISEFEKEAARMMREAGLTDAPEVWKEIQSAQPGPWYYDGPSSMTGAHIVHVADCEIAQVFGETEAEAEANARLVASAPVLVEALEDLLDTLYKNDYTIGPSNRYYLAAEKVLDQAKGE